MPHRPEATLLHQTVRDHLETFLARASERDHPVPRFVERAFRSYLACGVLARGFLRLHCDACGCDRLVPFSCKGRGFCPSCGGRRMADTAAYLVDRVLPEVAVRQWVLSLPFALRYRLAYDARLTSDVLGLFVRAVFASLRRRAWRKWGVGRGQCAAVTFVQRFGSALNLNVHFHTLVLDGVYPITEAGPSRFHPLPAPDDGEVARVVTATARRLARLLEKRGLGPDADPMESDPLAQEEPLLASLAAASLKGCVATGPRAGQRLLRLGDRVEPDDREYLEAEPPRRCASAGGPSLHADVAVPARDRGRLERLRRYVARPPLATERLTQLDDGRLCYRLKRRWRDGTTHLLLERVALLERLAALVPPPRFHLVRYHGILAPCASWRDRVVPVDPGPLIPQTSRTARTKEGPADTKRGGDGARSGPSHRGDPGTTAASGGVIPTNPECRATADVPTPAEGAHSPRLRRLPWSDLLQRVFAVDALACPRCGERLRLLAAIESPEAIRAILDCLGLPSRAPPLAPSEPEATSLELGFEELPTFET